MMTREEERVYKRDWHRAAYQRDPEKFKQRSRRQRKLFGVAINMRRRGRAAQKHEHENMAKWTAYQQNPPDGSLPWNEQLRLWFDAQPQFSSVRALARAVGVSARSVFDWLRGKHPPVREHLRKLHEITGLKCFTPPPVALARGKRPRYAEEVGAAAILKELVVRCGLATREIRRIEVSSIEGRGIRLASGRLIPFGEGWHCVSRRSLDAWMSVTKPTKYLFFQHKPADRNRPANPLWIVRMLKSVGIESRRSQTSRVRHFVGDFTQMRGNKKRFVRHLQCDHGFSKSGSREAWEELRSRKALADTAGRKLSNAAPAEAYDVLYPRVAVPALEKSPRRTPSEETIRRGHLCDQFIEELRRIKHLSLTGRTIAEIQLEYPDFYAWRVREALPAEDRDVFNHPRQWGPVVGYARMVLAKVYSRNEGTVKNWVKSFRRWHRSNPSTKAINQ